MDNLMTVAPLNGSASSAPLEKSGEAGDPSFQSILFLHPEDRTEPAAAPEFFVDLHLDQVVDALVKGKEQYNLKPLFYASLHNVDAIAYRHEIMHDLQDAELFGNVLAFARKMQTMRSHLAQAEKLAHKYQKERWFLDAVDVYCDAVGSLLRNLSHGPLKSHGFLALREYLEHYVGSQAFTSLLSATEQLKAALGTVQYCVLIEGNRVTVRKYQGETDYSAEVEQTFERFREGASKDYRLKLSEWPDMDYVEARILDLVAELYPEVFLNLDDYCARNSSYLDKTIELLDREMQFYVGYLELIAKLIATGLTLCFPNIAEESKEVYCFDGFDIALAIKLITENANVVCNNLRMSGAERILVVTGPNQGGKTTFARAFGQLHYLASLGCPVPGRRAQAYLFDKLFTHFEVEESIQDLRGKLEDDLSRIHGILTQATSRSIIIINEIFTSTTRRDALFLSTQIIERIIRLDALSVWVTFVDELASYNVTTVSMVSTVVPDNPAIRTFKILRRPADGLAYARAIAEKYRLTYDHLLTRVKS